MDFAAVNFPCNIPAQGRRRELFFDYGSHGNVDINYATGAGNREVFCQKVPQGFLDGNDSLCAKRPTLPFTTIPEESTNVTDKVMGKVFQIQKQATAFYDLAKYSNFKSAILKDDQKMAIRTYHQKLTAGQESDNDYSCLPNFIKRLAGMYQQNRSLTYFPKSNWEYAGGCTAWLPRPEYCNCDGFLVSVNGAADDDNFTRLRMTEMKINEEDLTLDKICTHVVRTEGIREVTAKCVVGQGQVAARSLSSCILYVYDADYTHFTSLGTIEFDKNTGEPASICLSEYIPGECLISTNTGSVYLWSAGKHEDQVLNERSTRFPCALPWRRAEFGSHPRQIIASDPTVVQLFDIRRGPGKEGVDLFALPNKHLLHGERIHMATQSAASEFHHFVFCDFSFFLVDERFPGNLMLSWKHMMSVPPMYIDGVNFPNKGHSLLLMAGQNPPEVCCYTYKCSSGMAAQALGAPWRVSSMDDFLHHESLCEGTEMAALKTRLNTSLAGIAAVPMDNGFFAVQMDSWGELFYQGYSFSRDTQDKTRSIVQSGDDFTVTRGKAWTSAYIRWLTEEKGHNRTYGFGAEEFYGITPETEPHASCPLCRPQNTAPGVTSDHCPSCCQSLATAQQLIEDGTGVVRYGKLDTAKMFTELHELPEGHVSESTGETHSSSQTDPPTPVSSRVSQTRRLRSRNIDKTEMPRGEVLPHTDALSKMLVALWEQDSPDLSDLLLERDEEIKQKRALRKEKAALKSDTADGSTAQNEDQQFITELMDSLNRDGSEVLPLGGTAGLSPPGGTASGDPASPPGGTEMVSPPEEAEEEGNDEEDFDLSFHHLFGLCTGSQKDDECEDEMDRTKISAKDVVGGSIPGSVENSDFTKGLQSPTKRRVHSTKWLSESENEDMEGIVAGSSSMTLSSPHTSKEPQREQHTRLETENDDSIYFSKESMQSFSMFSRSSVASPTLQKSASVLPSTPRSSSSKVKQFVSRHGDSPSQTFRSPKKKLRKSYGGF